MDVPQEIARARHVEGGPVAAQQRDVTGRGRVGAQGGGGRRVGSEGAVQTREDVHRCQCAKREQGQGADSPRPQARQEVAPPREIALQKVALATRVAVRARERL